MLLISFTTIPSRAQYIVSVFEKIHNQSLQPDKIIINYPDKCLRLNEIYDNEKIIKIINNSKLKDKIYLNKTKDYGPITKIYPLIHLDFIQPDDIIIIIDDDMDCNVYLFESLYNDFINRNSLETIALSGLAYPTKLNQPSVERFRPNCKCELIEASGGYIIKKSFLKDDLKDWVIDADSFEDIKRKNLSSWFLNDDHIISRYFDKNNIVKRVLKGSSKMDETYIFDTPYGDCLTTDVEPVRIIDALYDGLVAHHNFNNCVKAKLLLKERNLL